MSVATIEVCEKARGDEYARAATDRLCRGFFFTSGHPRKARATGDAAARKIAEGADNRLHAEKGRGELIVATHLALAEPALTAVGLRCGNSGAAYGDETVLLPERVTAAAADIAACPVVNGSGGGSAL